MVTIKDDIREVLALWAPTSTTVVPITAAVVDAQEHANTPTSKRPIESRFQMKPSPAFTIDDAFMQLDKLRLQLNAHADVNRSLDALIRHIKSIKKPTSDTLKTLNLTNDLLGGHIDVTEYNREANLMKGKPSKAYRVTGALMLLVGIAVSAALAATGIGLIAVAAAGVGALLVSSGFFAASRRTGSSKVMHDLAIAEENNPIARKMQI